LNIVWTKTLFSRLRQTLLQALQAVVIYARHKSLRLCYYYVILRVCMFPFAFVTFE